MELKRLQTKKENNSKTNFIEYLNKYYSIRKNRFNSEIIIKRKKDDKQLNVYDLLLELESYGVFVSKKRLDYYFKSSQIELVNPYVDILDSLPAWDEKNNSEINNLLAYIRTDDDDRSKSIFWKWLINSVLQITGKGINDVMLVLVSSERQGIGKTYLAKQLISLFNFIQTGQSLLKNIENLPEASVFYPFILYDELKGLRRPSELLLFKTIISSDLIEYRRFTHIYRQQRIANFIATADSSELLFDPSGSRRFAIIEINDIDFTYARKIDFRKIWSQVYYIVKNDLFKKFLWTQNDFRAFDSYNVKYYRTSSIDYFLQKYFQPTGIYDEALMTPSEVLGKLEELGVSDKIIAKTDPRAIGIALTRLGFQKYYGRRDNKVGRYYALKLKNNDKIS